MNSSVINAVNYHYYLQRNSVVTWWRRVIPIEVTCGDVIKPQWGVWNKGWQTTCTVITVSTISDADRKLCSNNIFPVIPYIPKLIGMPGGQMMKQLLPNIAHRAPKRTTIFYGLMSPLSNIFQALFTQSVILLSFFAVLKLYSHPSGIRTVIKLKLLPRCHESNREVYGWRFESKVAVFVTAAKQGTTQPCGTAHLMEFTACYGYSVVISLYFGGWGLQYVRFWYLYCVRIRHYLRHEIKVNEGKLLSYCETLRYI